MVSIGSVEFGAKITGVSSARRDASNLKSSLTGVGTAAENASENIEEAGDSMDQMSEQSDDASHSFSRFRSFTTLVSSGLATVTSWSFTTSGALGVLSGAATTASGAVSTLYATLVGPASLAAGLFTSVAAAGLLSTELRGVTDATGIQQKEFGTLADSAVDFGMIVGGWLPTVIGAGFKAIKGDFKGAKNLFITGMKEWVDASTRFAARMETGLNTIVDLVRLKSDLMGDALAFGIRKGINKSIDSMNWWIKKTNNLSDKLGIDDMQTIDNISNRSLESRFSNSMAGTRNDIIGQADQSRRDIAATRQQTQNRTVDNTTINNNTEVTVEGAQVKDMNRRELRELARMISEEQGNSINRSID